MTSKIQLVIKIHICIESTQLKNFRLHPVGKYSERNIEHLKFWQ